MLMIRTCLAGCVCLALFTAGCGRSAVKTARLAGSVTLDGQPLKEGRLQFMPMDQDAAGPATAEIAGGRYQAANVPLGNVKAYITATRETGKMNTEYSQPFPERENIIPAKYAPGFDLTITGDKRDQNFVLESR